MSPALQAVVGLAVGYLIGAVPFARIARRRRDQASHHMKVANAWQRSFYRLSADLDRGACCPSCQADREILRSGCTPPRAGVDA